MKGSLLSGVTDDLTTWLPPTHDPFLFAIGGSIAAKAPQQRLERDIEQRIARLRDRTILETSLAKAKTAVLGAIGDDVVTTEDAAHQLAFFEGIGALDVLLDMPRHVSAVTAADIQRVARAYLDPNRLTIGWMVPGKPAAPLATGGKPTPAGDRPGAAPVTGPASEPQIQHLSGGLPAIVKSNPLSDTVTVELLLSSSLRDGDHPKDLPGLDAIIRSGRPQDIATLIGQSLTAARGGPASATLRSDDPATRIEQLIEDAMALHRDPAPKPLAVIVSGNVDPRKVFEELERQLGRVAPAKLTAASAGRSSDKPKMVREHIAKPLSQGALGYVVEAPPPGSREALAWRMLLYTLTHDYSGRLGWSAIFDKGLVYHIYSSLRTDGRRSWVVISTGVDPDKADAMEAELRSQLARLVTEPPTAAEVEAARHHLLGRDLTAAQSNEELTAKLAREFVETGGLRSHEQFRAQLQTITPADLATAAEPSAAARSFA